MAKFVQFTYGKKAPDKIAGWRVVWHASTYRDCLTGMAGGYWFLARRVVEMKRDGWEINPLEV